MALYGALSEIEALIPVLPPYSAPLPMVGANRPILMASSGSALILNTGNIVKGLNIGETNTYEYAISQSVTNSVGPLHIEDVAIYDRGCLVRLNNTNGVGAVVLKFDSLITTACETSLNSIRVLGVTEGSFTVDGDVTIDLYSGGINLAVPEVTFNGAVVLDKTIYISASGTVAFNQPVAIGLRRSMIGDGVVLSNLTGSVLFTHLEVKNHSGNAIRVGNATLGGRLTILNGNITTRYTTPIHLSNTTVDITLDTVSALELQTGQVPIFQSGVVIENLTIGTLIQN